MAFQLERLVAGMYIYYRQCHRYLKPAAVFPIEVELGIDLDASKRYYYGATEEPGDSILTPPASDSETKKDSTSTDKLDEPLPAIDDLLLDLGLIDPVNKDATAAIPPMQLGELEQPENKPGPPSVPLIGSEQ